MLYRPVLRLFVVLSLVIQILPMPASRAATGDAYVAPSGLDANDCTSPTTPCATIDAAIGKASSGATVFVAVGTYTNTGTSVVRLNKNVTLSGGWDAAFAAQVGLSTLDGEGARRVIDGGPNCLEVGTVTAALTRLRIIRGYAETSGGNIKLYCTTLTISQSEIAGGASSDYFAGAALYVSGNSVVEIRDSLIANNWADAYGQQSSITNGGGSLTLINTTVTGAERAGASGVAIDTFSGTLILKNSTITGYRTGLAISGTNAVLDNTIVYGNGYRDCEAETGYAFMPAYSGVNVVGTQSGCNPRAQDLVGVDPGLGALKNNGGLTATHAIGPDSPAFGAGVGCSLDHDQRGVARPANCSVGAYEPFIVAQKTVDGVLEPGGTVTYTLTITAPGTTPLTNTILTDTLTTPLTAVPGSAQASVGAVSLVGNTLTWSGTADPATPPVITVQAQIDPASPRQIIRNVAEVDWQGIRGPSAQASFDNHFFQPVPALANQFCGDFSDDFSNPAGGWPVFESDLRRLEYVGGEYRLLTKQAGYVYLMGAPTCPRGNQTVEVDLRWVGTPGSDIGLAIEEVGPTGNMYLVLIDVTTTYYVVVRYDPTGRPAVISNGSTHGSMNTGNGTNRLSVDFANGNIRIRNNGWNITDFNYQSSSSLAWVGVAAAPNDNQSVVDARFDNFRVVRFAGANMPSGASALSGVTAPQLEVFDGRLLPFTTQGVEHDEPATPFDRVAPQWSADRALP